MIFIFTENEMHIMILDRIQKQIGNFNRTETIYLLVFVLSIIAGIAYGIINQNFYKCCEDTLSLQPGQNEFTIFERNFGLAFIALITGGFSAFYILFITFAISSSSLLANGEIFAIIFILILGSLELTGVFLFGISGFVVLERKILKAKSNLKIKKIILIGIILLFISAVIEYFLVR